MALRSSDRERTIPRTRIQPTPPRTDATESAAEAKVGIGRRGRVLYLGPPEPPPAPTSPRKPDSGANRSIALARVAQGRDKAPDKVRTPRSIPLAAVARTAAEPRDPPRQPPRRFDLQTLVREMRAVEARRRHLRREIESRERLVGEAERSLERTDWPVIGRLRRRSQEATEERLTSLVGELGTLRRELQDTVVAADFKVDADARILFAELARRFEVLQAGEAGDASPRTPAERARVQLAGSNGPTARPTRPAHPALEPISSQVPPLHLRHANGGDLFIFPCFIMVANRAGEPALDDIRRLFISVGTSPAPGSARAGKPQTATGRGGELLVTLPTGFDEAYRLGDRAACEAFVDAFSSYLGALPELITPPPQPPVSEKPSPRVVRPPAPVPAPSPRPAPVWVATPAPGAAASAPIASRLEAVADAPRAQHVDPQSPPEIRPPAPEISPESGCAGMAASAPGLAALPQTETTRYEPQVDETASLHSETLPVRAFDLPTPPTAPEIAPDPGPVDVAAVDDLAAGPEPTESHPASVSDAATSPGFEPLPALDVSTPLSLSATAPDADISATAAAAIDDSPMPSEPTAGGQDPDATASSGFDPAFTIDVSTPLAVLETPQNLDARGVAAAAGDSAVLPEPTTSGEYPDATASPGFDPVPTIDVSTPLVVLETPQKLDLPGEVAAVDDSAVLPEPEASASVEPLPTLEVLTAPPFMETSPAPDTVGTAAAIDDFAARPELKVSWQVLVPDVAVSTEPLPVHDVSKPAAAPEPAIMAASTSEFVPVSEPGTDQPQTSGAEGAGHWSEPLVPALDTPPAAPTPAPTGLEISASDPAPEPRASSHDAVDDEKASHWSEPISRLHVPVWPPISGVSGSADAPAPASISVGDAPVATDTAASPSPNSRSLVSPQVSVSRAAAMPGLAAVSAYLSALRQPTGSAAEPSRQASPESVRPSRLSASLSMAGLVRKRTWTGMAAVMIVVMAVAALAPSLWQQRTETAATATTAPAAPAAMQTATPPPAPAPTQTAPPPKAEAPAPSPAPQRAEAARPLTATQVAQLQGRLKALGFDPGKVDGMIGPRTIAAATEFQAVHKFPVTGAIDTWLLDDVSVVQARMVGSTRTR